MDEKIFAGLFRAHPWHGIPIGERAPEEVAAYIEIVPSDTVKYELDKPTGHLKIDRPQQFSNVYPTLYGLIPQTYCGERVAAYCMEHIHRRGIRGDGDPLDVCVLAEKTITHGDVLLHVRPIGGLRMLDGDEADDKIIAVLLGDAVYGHMHDIHECPPALVTRLKHYFLTYKQDPGSRRREAEITQVYDRAEALAVIDHSVADYMDRFSDLAEALAELRRR